MYLNQRARALSPRALSLPDDPAAIEVARCQLHDDPVPHEQANEIPLDPAADVRRNPVRIDFYFVQPARQLSANNPLDRPIGIAHTRDGAREPARPSSSGTRSASAGSSVRISQPSGVTTTVCSKCA